VLTVAAVAANKGIEPERIDVQIERQTTEGTAWRTAFVIHIDLGQGLSRREQIILLNSARHCEVHKLLGGEMSFDYQIVHTPPSPSA
jgi:uncharacterized OsmC-like protein